MKTSKHTLVLLFASTLLINNPARAVDYGIRTDVNPALIYWEVLLMQELYTDIDSNFELLDRYETTREITPETAKVLESYDQRFQELDRATKMNAKVDWGLEPTDGPNLLLPHLGRCKFLSRIARGRIQMHLMRGDESSSLKHTSPDEAAALKDTYSTLVLARYVASDPYLICILVDYAMEKIVINAVAENFDHFSDDALRTLDGMLANLPPRGAVADSIPIEKNYMAEWIEHKILEIQKTAPSEEAALAEIKARVISAFTEDDIKQIIKDGKNSVEGILAEVRETYPYYDQLEALMKLPIQQAIEEVNQFYERIENNRNRVSDVLFPALQKSIVKDAEARVRFAQLRAAIQYRLGGRTAMERIMDPMGDGPFELRESTEGDKKGFVIVSAFDDPDVREMFFPATSEPNQ